MFAAVRGTVIIAAVWVLQRWTHAMYAMESEYALTVRERAESSNTIDTNKWREKWILFMQI